MRLLSGSEIIHKKLNGPKELPPSGWKEYSPTNSWLEQKQIQASLEDKCSTIAVERIEKQNNLARAEWVDDFKKAKVLKKVGKYWEVVGHHQDNEDWLLPEEALYLIEINVLELIHEGVPVSVQHAYALLISELNGFSLEEYRVYSYLSRRGYKLIRHSEDITVTRYEKQINLDLVLETQKRNTPGSTCEISSPQELHSSECIDESSVNKIQKPSEEISVENMEISINNDKISTKEKNDIEIPTKRRLSDTEDIYIVEDSVEVVVIEDPPSKTPVKDTDTSSIKHSTVNEVKKPKAEKFSFPNDFRVIVIDDDRNETKDLDNDSEDDVVILKSTLLKSREWYKPVSRALTTTEIVVVDLSEDVQVKNEKPGNCGGKIITANKSRKDILNGLVNAKDGVAFIQSPSPYFTPNGIRPRHSQYRVNLNKRQEPMYPPHRNYQPYYPGRRPQQNYYNPNYQNNRPVPPLLNTSSHPHVVMQAFEMRTMAINMMRAASKIMSAMNSPSCSNNPMNQIVPSSYYSPRPNYNQRMLTYNNYTGNQNNPVNQRGRRNTKFRGHWNNARNTSSHIKRGRYYKRTLPHLKTREIISIDSDDEADDVDGNNVGYSKRKESSAAPVLSKKIKLTKPMEVIDLCDDGPIKIENPRDNTSLKIINNKTETNLETENKEKCKQEIETIINNEESTKSKIESRNVENLKEIKLSPSVKPTVQENPLEITSNTTSDSIKESSTEEIPKINEEFNDSAMEVERNELNDAAMDSPENDLETICGTEPSTWQQYKEQSDQNESPNRGNMVEDYLPLVQPHLVKDIGSLLKSLHIFETIDDKIDETKKIKISFDAYSPASPFKKTLKTLPKFRIVVVNSDDPLPSHVEMDTLKSLYQDGIPFLYAIVCDDSIAFYLYDSVQLPVIL